jgi:hypothetical protein
METIRDGNAKARANFPSAVSPGVEGVEGPTDCSFATALDGGLVGGFVDSGKMLSLLTICVPRRQTDSPKYILHFSLENSDIRF